MNFGIYRLCNNAKSLEKLKQEKKRYSLDHTLIQDEDFSNLIKNIVNNDQLEYALISLDHVVLPWNIKDLISKMIDKANEEYGKNKWLMLGNCGIEFLSLKKYKYFSDQQDSIISTFSRRLRPVVFLDANTIILNLSSFRQSKVRLEKDIKSPDSVVFSLLMKGYTRGLISAMDSKLFVYHKYQQQEDGSALNKNQGLVNYCKDNFINHFFYTLDGIIKIEGKLTYLKNEIKDTRGDLYKKIEGTILEVYKKRKKRIYLIVRSMLNRNNRLYRLLDSINSANLFYKEEIELRIILSINNSGLVDNQKIIEYIKINYSEINIDIINNIEKEEEGFPRVIALRNAINKIEEEDVFAWIVDDDDFIFPNALKYLSFTLYNEAIFLGNSIVFEEKWEEKRSYPIVSRKIRTYNTSTYYESLSGVNSVPICSVIYPIKTLKRIINNYQLKGDYNEDYAIFLLAQKELQLVDHYEINLAGVSSHGENTVAESDRTHWNYSYSTFMNEIVNAGLVGSGSYGFFEGMVNEQKTGKSKIGIRIFMPGSLYLIYKKYRKGGYDEIIAKGKNVYRRKGLIKTIQFIFKYFQHGRAYFRDGVNALD